MCFDPYRNHNNMIDWLVSKNLHRRGWVRRIATKMCVILTFWSNFLRITTGFGSNLLFWYESTLYKFNFRKIDPGDPRTLTTTNFHRFFIKYTKIINKIANKLNWVSGWTVILNIDPKVLPSRRRLYVVLVCVLGQNLRISYENTSFKLFSLKWL